VLFSSSDQAQGREVNMKRTALTAMILVVLAASCTQAPTATPSLALPTTTPRIEAATLVATNTPTAMYTPTASPTATPTATPTPMPELSLDNGRFFANGREIVLRGAVASHFDYNVVEYHNTFEGDIDRLKSMGANFVILQWNSAYLDSPEYIQKLISGLQYAKSKGFRVALVLHARGIDDKETRFLKEKQIEVVDDSIRQDWERLLSDPAIASDISNSVDIFNPLSEPAKNARGGWITWSEWKPIAESILASIRSKTRKNALGIISGVQYAAIGKDALTDPPDRYTGVEIHPYEWTIAKDNYQTLISAAKKKGVLILAGEIGFDDRPEFVKEQVEFLITNASSFAWFAVNSNRTNKDFLFNGFARTLTGKGKIAEESFQAEK
jgi:hypothetical protein